MRNRLTTEVAANTMLGDTTEHQLSPHWKEMRRQGLKDFSKFSFTGVNLKELLPGMQNWATAWQRKYLMQHASEEKSSCYWLHRTFKIHYKQVRKSFNEIPELNSPAQFLNFYGTTQPSHYLQHKLLNSVHNYYMVFITRTVKQSINMDSPSQLTSLNAIISSVFYISDKVPWQRQLEKPKNDLHKGWMLVKHYGRKGE